MIAKIIFPIHLVLILWSVEAFATIYNYEVSGSFVAEGATKQVSGGMQISDEFFFSEAGYYTDPTYYFEIYSYDLTVYEGGSSYTFAGDNGGLYYFHQVTDPVTGYKACEEQWGISSSASSWSSAHDAFRFYTPEMVIYDPVNPSEYYGTLATKIALYGPEYASQYTDPFTDGGLIWLTRAGAPIPEPATMLLFATGLVVPFVASGRRRKMKPAHGSNSKID